MRHLKFLLGLSLFCWISCVKPPDLPDTPTVKSIEFNYTSIPGVAGGPEMDPLEVSIEFEDGDGDLNAIEGEPTPHITLKDIRTGNETEYELTDEVNNGSSAVSGRFIIQIEVVNVCCCCINEGIVCLPHPDLPDTDELEFEVWITDRAGNVSEPFISPPLTLECTL